ncbi:bifunctional precorrin-2 dehydrogenase/sirohydrochlorin ferrochelatase [Pyrofollis japonicus]|uniref:precorrin-2 dehydrogenase/sirohydrochlorin ferrochelatase family protein n=1 Tax=Pyrofollis japonicus TaxID=3060460 RepID=UPI00295B6374|nr:NAD(P)-dependent oxidoreductase [Pyrofollis japonicus]BEP17380.1 bifunctional precorrin-2 dehydrogenase/sirohydrochlorin ferrochelatase [Pyrofollis japonicus]
MRIPLWLEMRGRRVLVVGGGSVGTRRALMFLDAGAEVKVVAKEFSEKLREAAAKNNRLTLVEGDAGNKEFLRPLVEWADIVVVATDNELVNSRVWELAKKARKWVNDATSAERTEIVVPYSGEVYGGGLRVAVTSEGKTGVAARHALHRIIKCLEEDKELRMLYEAMRRLKPVLKKHVAVAKQRVPIYYEVEEQILPLIQQGASLEEVLETMANYLEKRLRQLGVEADKQHLLGELKQA